MPVKKLAQGRIARASCNSRGVACKKLVRKICLAVGAIARHGPGFTSVEIKGAPGCFRAYEITYR